MPGRIRESPKSPSCNYNYYFALMVIMLVITSVSLPSYPGVYRGSYNSIAMAPRPDAAHTKQLQGARAPISAPLVVPLHACTHLLDLVLGFFPPSFKEPLN